MLAPVRPIRFRIAVVLCLLLSSCGGHGGSSGGPLARIEITPQQTNVTQGTTLQLSVVAKTASGSVVDHVAFSWKSLDPSIATIDANGVVTGQKTGLATITAATGNFTGSATIGVVSSSQGSANFALSGIAQYEDKPFSIDGFTGAVVPTPIRGAIIEVIAIEGFVPLEGGSGTTDQEGKFNFTALNNASRKGGVYLRIQAKTESNNPTQVEIRNNSSDQALLALTSSGLDDSASSAFPNVTLLASADSGAGGAFNLLDVFSRASELVQQSGPCPTPDGKCVPPLLKAYWEPGSSTGTYYDDVANAIFILGGGTADGDTDEYDDSVVAHEYGHFVVAHFSHDDSPGGDHRISDNTEDIRLSWSEGWGNFFSSAVRNDPTYVDTNEGGVALSFELEHYTSPQFDSPTRPPTAPKLADIVIYDTSELAVAGVLWDIFDPAGTVLDDPQDSLALGFQPIWQTVISLPTATQATMESFWTQFTSLNPSAIGGLQNILQERKVEFSPDQYETAEQDLAVGTTQHHTLYQNGPDPTGDEDIIPFEIVAGVPYTLETFNLTNGADTLLTITDASEKPIPGLVNDNRNNQTYSNCGINSLTGNSNCPSNNKTNLSSSIAFSMPAASATKLHAHVQRSPKAPPSAGLFGSYDIRLKTP